MKIFGMIPMNPMKPTIADILKTFVGVLHTHPALTPFFKIEEVFARCELNQNGFILDG